MAKIPVTEEGLVARGGPYLDTERLGTSGLPGTRDLTDIRRAVADRR